MGTNQISLRVAAMLVLLVAPQASAQRPQQQLGSGAESPWVQGVSQERQEAAAVLFAEANDYYEKALFVKAAELYRKALEQWDHPAIHYNLALALTDTAQKLELREHLEAAIRYGPKPLDEKLFEHARQRKNSIEKQLVRVEVSCEISGTLVTMNERLLLRAPGRFVGWVLPGTHHFVAAKEGMPPNKRVRTPGEGETITLNISQLYDDEALTRYRRSWSTWKPWAVLGVGVAVAAGGGALHLRARNGFRGFDERAAACGTSGCPWSPELEGLRSQGMRSQKIAVGAYAAGGALFTTGAVLAFINRAQPYLLTPDEYEQGTAVSLQVGLGKRELWATVWF